MFEDIFKKINRYIIIIFSLFLFFTILFLFIYDQIIYIILGSYFIVSWIFFIIIFYNIDHSFYAIKNKKLFQIPYLSYIILLLLSSIILYINKIRPHIYFLIFSILFLIIFYDISYSSKNKDLLLIIIGFLYTNLNWGVSLKYYYFFSRTDVFFHVRYINSILNNNNIYINSIYKNFPLWHILNSIFIMFTNINISTQKNMFILNGIIYFIIVLLLYYFALVITKNNKISLYTSLMFIANIDVINNGMYSIPRSVTLLFEVISLLLMYKKFNMSNFIIIILCITSIIIVHPASIPFIIIIYLLIYLFKKMSSRTYNIINFKILIITISLTFIYWIFASENMFYIFINNIFSELMGGRLIGVSAFTLPYTELIIYLQYSPIIIFIFIAFFKGLLIKDFNFNTKHIIIMSTIFLFFVIPGPLSFITRLSRMINIGRLNIYVIPFIVITEGIGIYILINQNKKKILIIIMSLLFLYSFLSISNDLTASDNPILKRDYYTYYFSKNEYITILDVQKLSNQTIYSDYTVVRLLNEIDNKAKYLLNDNNKIFINETGIVLLRYSELESRKLQIQNIIKNSNQFLWNYIGKEDFKFIIEENNLIFNSKDIKSYLIYR